MTKRDFKKSFGLMTALVSLIAALLPAPAITAPRSVPASEKTSFRLASESTSKQVNATLAHLPLSFEANRGQADSKFKFISRSNSFISLIGATETTFGLQNDSTTTVLKMKMMGANEKARAAGLEELPGKTSYLTGNDSKNWKTNIPAYSRIRFENVYAGIDVVYYGKGQQLEYDFIVAPGADPDRINIEFEGAESMRVDSNGDLVLATLSGEVRQHCPVAFQTINGVRKKVAARHVLRGKHRTGIRLASYDRSKPLTIDPVLSYSTYLGSQLSHGQDVAVDSQGNAYVAGVTNSASFPTTPGVYQSASGGLLDVFVAKLNPTGTSLIYSTYLGGASGDWSLGIAVDGDGNAFVAGYTFSQNFPVTAGAFQTAFGGDSTDGFVVRLNSTGTSLIYSTYLGGSDDERCRDIAVDSSGNAYVAGGTRSSDFPVTAGAFQTSLSRFDENLAFTDAFVAKLNASGSALVYSTYLGGGEFQDEAYGIAADSEGNAYVTGLAFSKDFPVTAGALKTSKDSIIGDGFVTKLNASGSALIYSTFVGGSEWEDSRSIAIDSSGNAYITGLTTSTDMPAVNAAQPRPGSDVVMKSANSGSAWVGTGSGLLAYYVWDIKIDPSNPSIIYAGTRNGVFKSSNGGGNWSAINDGIPRIPDVPTNYQSIISIAIDPSNTSTLYAATGGVPPGGVYKSTDGGSHWVVAGLDGNAVTALVIDPANPSTVYAGTAAAPSLPGGVFKTTDGGNTWTAMNAGLSDLDVNALAIDAQTPTTLYVGTNTGLFKSVNGGAIWSENVARVAVHTVAIDPTRPATVYISTSADDYSLARFVDGRGNPRRRLVDVSGTIGNGVFRSTDGGETFDPINNGFPFDEDFYANTLAVDPQTPSVLYAGTDFGLFRSASAGASWNPTSLGGMISTGPDVWTLALDASTSPSTIYANSTIAGDAYVAKLNATGTLLIYSTYLGGLSKDEGQRIAIDSTGNVYVIGVAQSNNFPVSGGAPQATFGGGVQDVFVTKLDAAGGFVYSTYLGGSGNDEGNGIAVDSMGNAYVTGLAGGSFPVTAGALKTSYGGGDAFVAKIDNSAALAPAITSVEVHGKKLYVFGHNFSANAVIMIDGREEKTKSDSESKLTGKKSGKKIRPGQSVMIRVKNAGGAMSDEFRFSRPPQ